MIGSLLAETCVWEGENKDVPFYLLLLLERNTPFLFRLFIPERTYNSYGST